MADKRPATFGSPHALILPLLLGISLAFIVVFALNTNSTQAKVNDRITVTTTEDELIDNGNCSLREAIMAVSTQTPVDTCGTEGFDTIYLPSGLYTLTIAGSGEDDNATGDLDIKSNVTILGTSKQTTIIDGNQLDRVLQIHSGAVVSLTQITVRNGRAPNGIVSSFFNDGESGGGIANAGSLRLTDCQIVSNRAGSGSDGINGGDGGNGGGIANTGHMSIIQCDISNNQAGDGGTNEWPYYKGNGGKGGGLTNNGTVEIKNSAISYNKTGSGDPAGDGGGIYNAGSLFITQSLISSNVGSAGNCVPTSPYGCASCSRSGFGGGIYNDDVSEVHDSLIIENNTRGKGSGAGIYNNNVFILQNSTIKNNSIGMYWYSGSYSVFGGGGIHNAATMIIDQCTITGNKAGSGSDSTAWWKYGCGSGCGENGGGIYNNDQLTIKNTTISGNFAGDGGKTDSFSEGGGGDGGDGGGIYNLGILTVTNVTIASNETGSGGVSLNPNYDNGLDGTGGGIENLDIILIRNTIIAGNKSVLTGPDCKGTLISTGYNLIGTGDDCLIIGDVTDNITGTDPLLSVLADKGGPTLTHALAPGSPAIDAGSCLDSEGITVTVDQRGVTRPIGPTCDIGAYEAPVFLKYYLTVVMR